MKKSIKKTDTKNIIQEVDFTEEAKRRYYLYGVEVNEHRAIPSGFDGLKPVARRGLWSVHRKGGHSSAKFTKAAVYVGDTLGKYHPHGDSSCYGALVTLVNSPIPLIEGEGNWGSLSDSSYAAMRYTEMRLSLYSDLIFFDKFYLPTMTKVLNYDYSEDEPLVLVSLLPNLLLNGNFGVGVGVRIEIPSFTISSLGKVLSTALYNDREITVKDCLKLEFSTLYGGEAIENKEEFKKLFGEGKGKIAFRSTYEMIDKHTINIVKFANVDVAKAIEKVALLKDVVSVNDISDVKDRYGRIEICFKKTLSTSEVTNLAEKIVTDQFGSSSAFDVSVTDRYVDDKGQGSAKLRTSSVIEVLNDWIAYRVDIEKKACTYWIDQRQTEIDRLNLMILAVLNREFIIKALNKKLDDDQLAAYIAKGLKITIEQANSILDLKIRALKALEEGKLRAKVKELKEEISGYKIRIKKPKEYIYQHVKDLTKKIEAAYPR